MYIVIEGIDGAGTTTQTILLSERLGCTRIREPSDRELGQRIRKMIQSNERPDQWASFFAGDRIEQYQAVTLGRVTAGEHVVSDRCLVSSLAYQADMHGKTFDEVVSINQAMILPDLIIMLDIPPGVAMERIRQRARNDPNQVVVPQFENESWLTELVTRYERAIQWIGARGVEILRIDGTMEIEHIADTIFAEVVDGDPGR